MKLIIDIDEKDYANIKDCPTDYEYSVALMTIANGTPYEERPQGEWEKPFEMNGKTYHKCNHCHISSELILIDKFCPNCGADMRKGGTE